MTKYEEIRGRDNSLTGYKRTSDGANIPIDNDNIDYREYLDWVEQGDAPDLDPSASLADFKLRAKNDVRVKTGTQIVSVGDWGLIRQSNASDGLYPNIVRPSDSVVFSFFVECKKYRASIIGQGNIYEDAIDAAVDIPAVLNIVAGVLFDTMGILTYSEVKGQING